MQADGHGARLCAGGQGGNPDFLAEWLAMSEVEYAASIRDVPEEILDAAPADLPGDIWLRLKTEEAARLPDPLADPAGQGLPGRWPPCRTRSWVTGR